MPFRFKKTLINLIVFDLLRKKITQLIYQRIDNIQAKIHKIRTTFLVFVLVLLLLIGLLILAFVFGILALALYLNEILYSTYQGFLVVAGGCIAVLILLLILARLYWAKKK